MYCFCIVSSKNVICILFKFLIFSNGIFLIASQNHSYLDFEPSKVLVDPLASTTILKLFFSI